MDHRPAGAEKMTARGRLRRVVLPILTRWYRSRGLRRTEVNVAAVQAAAQATIERSRYCVLATGDGEQIDARVLQPGRPGPGMTIHLGTSRASRKIGQIRRSSTVVLVYTDFRRGCGVVVHAEAELVDDPAISRAWFLPVWRAFWPDGPDDPDFLVIRCRPTAIEVWDGSRGITPAPFGLVGARIERTDASWSLVG